MSKATDLVEVERFFKQSEEKFRAEFLMMLADMQSTKRLSLVRTYLEQGNVALAVETLTNSDDSNILAIFLSIYLSAASFQLKLTEDQINKLRGRRWPALSFDPTDPKVSEKVRELVTRFLNDFKQSQTDAALSIINDGIANNDTPSKIVNTIRRKIGLNSRQIVDSQTYEEKLKTNSQETLDRSLRDDNFDELISAGALLLSADRQRMLDAYIVNQRFFRVDLLTNNIVGDVAGSAFEDAMQQVFDREGLDTNALVKEWRSMRDSRVRYTHSMHGGMDGQIVPFDGYFVSPSGARLKYPRDGNAPIKETANCRCRNLIYVKEI